MTTEIIESARTEEHDGDYVLYAAPKVSNGGFIGWVRWQEGVMLFRSREYFGKGGRANALRAARKFVSKLREKPA